MSKKLAIAMFGQKRLSREGGVEIVVKELCTRMAQNGCDVTCYNRAGHHVSGAEYDDAGKTEYEGIRQKSVPTIERRGLAAVSSSAFNRINFNADGYEVLPVIISPERKKQLNQNLMMFFTGFTRFSSDVQKANAAGKQDKTAQLKEMLALVDDAERVLTDKNADLDDFGRMLDHTWKLKCQTGSAVSTNSIDELYAKGVAAGALGGKLLGAGGGGFLVFYVQPERQDAVRWAMRDLMHIPFAFEDGGTRVIHYTPETYEPKN